MCQPVSSAEATKYPSLPSLSSPLIYLSPLHFPFHTNLLLLLQTISISLSVPMFRHFTASSLLTSAPAGSSRRTGGTGEEKEEEEEKVPALPAGSTVELVDLGLPERGTRSCAYASTLTIHNPRIHSRRAIIRHCPSQVRCRSNIEKDRNRDGNTNSGLILVIMNDLGSLKKIVSHWTRCCPG